MATALKFNKLAIEKIPLPESGRVTYLDTDPPGAVRRDAVPGLHLVVSYTGVKSFVLTQKLNGRPKRVTIGRFPAWTVDMARKNARQLIATMSQGIDPIKERRAAKFRGITVKEAFDDYLDTRATQLKESTKNNYRMMINSHLSDWQSKPMVDITGELIQRKHASLTKKSPTAANSTMKVLRAIYHFGQSKYVDEHGSHQSQAGCSQEYCGHPSGVDSVYRGGGAIADTGYELYAACETVKDLDQLCSDLGMADETLDDVVHSVCGPELPDAREIWGGVVEDLGRWWESLVEGK